MRLHHLLATEVCHRRSVMLKENYTIYSESFFYVIQATTGYHSELAKENPQASHIKSPYWHQPINQDIYLIV